MVDYIGLLEESEEWLINRILGYANKFEFTKYASPLSEALKLSISRLSNSLISAVNQFQNNIPEFHPDDTYTDDAVSYFGIIEARKNRQQGIPLGMFMGFVKYYKKSYLELIETSGLEMSSKQFYIDFTQCCFERIEIAYCIEWSSVGDKMYLTDIKGINREIASNKNKYLTIFDSSFVPTIYLDEKLRIADINQAATELFADFKIAGLIYYEDHSSNASLKELNEQIGQFFENKASSTVFETCLQTNKGNLCFQVKLKTTQGVSHKNNGIIVLFNDITGQKIAEQKVEESKLHYNAIFEISADPINIIYNDRYIDCNQATLDAMCIKSKDEFLKMSPWELSPQYQPDGRLSKEKGRKMIEIAIDKGYHQFDWVKINSLGENNWYSISVTKKVIDGKTIFYTNWRDIQIRKEQEEELILLTNKLSKAQRIGSVGHFEWYKNDDYVTGSDEYYRIFETTPEHHSSFNDFINSVHIEDRGKVYKALEKASEKKQNYDVEYRLVFNHRKNKYVQATGEYEFDEHGTPTYLLGLVRDITELKEAERIVKENEKHLLTIFNASQVGIALHKDKKLIFLNHYMCDVLNYSFDDVLGKDSKEFYASEDLCETAELNMTERLKVHNSVLQETKLKSIDGEIVNALLNSAFYNGKNSDDGIITVITDITKLKNTEKELIKLNNEKNKFFSIIAHDLKSPIGSTISLLDLLNNNFVSIDDEKKELFISSISSQIKKTYMLLENLLTWSRSQLGNIKYCPERQNVNEFIRESISVLLSSLDNKQISLSTNIDKNIHFFADKPTIDTVIRNLFSNAIKFSHRKGCIQINASVLNKANKVKISVENNGKDISKDILAKLFTIEDNVSSPGTENEQGTGLGLVLCKEFVENNGGEIWAESEAGKGAKFSFTLPIIE